MIDKTKYKLPGREDTILQEILLDSIADFIHSGKSITGQLRRAENMVKFTKDVAVKLKLKNKK